MPGNKVCEKEADDANTKDKTLVGSGVSCIAFLLLLSQTMGLWHFGYNYNGWGKEKGMKEWKYCLPLPMTSVKGQEISIRHRAYKEVIFQALKATIEHLKLQEGSLYPDILFNNSTEKYLFTY